MKILATCTLALVLLLSACGPSKPANLGYDPAAKPLYLVQAARKDAANSGKRGVFVIAGGEWCRWCHVLDRFLSDNDDVKKAMEDSFVVVKVYAGEDDHNDDFFARLPPAPGYPHFWVIDNAGNVRSIGTESLESGDDDYDKGRFLDMLRTVSQ